MSGRTFIYLLIVLVCSITVITGNASKNCDRDFDSSECKFLRENIVQHLIGEPCVNFHSYTCSKTNNIETSLRQIKKLTKLVEIEKDLKDILHSPEYNEIVVAERDLYYQCLKLGTDNDHREDEKRNKYPNYYSLFTLHKHVISNSKWQDIDNDIAGYDFGHAFFDVSVVQDPEDPSNGIIMLEPPPIAKLNSTYQFLKQVFYNSSLIGLYSDYNNVENHKDLYNYAKKLLRKPIDEFFDSWIYTIDEVSSEFKFIQFPNNKTTIEYWSQNYNDRLRLNTTNEIQWENILTKIFKRHDIYIDSSQPIIVKNVNYFKKLFNLLANTPNNVTAMAVILKAVTENLKYVDWNFAQRVLINYDNKETFCLQETKLYGPSYKLLFDFKRRRNNERIIEIVRNINKAMTDEIHHAPLSQKNKSYLLAELDKMTNNVFEENWSADSLSKIYGRYEIRNNYLISIIAYRQMLKKKEFSQLNKNGTSYPTKPLPQMPFSATDLNIPSNRFLMHLISVARILDDELSNQNTQKTSLKEYYYGNYGTKISSFLYGLLNENKFEDPYRHKNLLAETHPEFSYNMLQCLITRFGEFKKLFGTAAITQLYGLQIAYQAMHYSYLGKEYEIKDISFSDKNITSEDQFFFLSYARSVCADQNPRVVNTAVSNIDQFIYEFGCDRFHYYDKLKCTKRAFEDPNGRAFLIKL